MSRQFGKSTTITLVAAAVTALAFAAVTVPASAGQSQRLPAVIEAEAPSLHPEGISYDRSRNAFLVSSLRHGTVSTVAADGTVDTLIDDPALISTIGVHVDAHRHRVLVANSDNGTGIRSTPETLGKVAGLGIYDLDTGERIDYIDLAALAPNAGGHFANDIAISPHGTAYVTDAAAGIVYEVDLDGNASVVVEDVKLAPAPGGTGANGIVYRHGNLIVGNYTEGTLWRIDLDQPDQVTQVDVEGDFLGVDGLTLDRRGNLIAVTNTLGGNGTNAVQLVDLSRDWTEGEVDKHVEWPDAATTVTLVKHRAYAVSGQLDILLDGSMSDNFILRRF